jgi:thioredoxin reductase
MQHHKVIIIGGGPAGLGAARRFNAQGLNDVVVLEREAEAGGIPRHCGHWGFGWESHRRLMTGPNYAKLLSSGLDVRCGTSVLEFTLRGTLRVHSSGGITELSADRILLAMGAREQSRSARMIGGSKPQGVMNTGTFQAMVYGQNLKPFSKPVIIGSEWVSYSALMTCRHAGIKPVAMLEDQPRSIAPRIFRLGAKAIFGVGLLTNTKLLAIHGQDQVTGVDIERAGQRQTIACDGVIISGKLRAENALYQSGLIACTGYSPTIDAQYRTSNPQIYAVGNLVGDIKTAGRCARDGEAAAQSILKDLP